MKLVPLTVRVKALLPTTFDVGERLVIVGMGLFGGKTEATCIIGIAV